MNRLGSSAVGHLVSESLPFFDFRGVPGIVRLCQESANLAKAQVLQQVGTAMLAQANAQPQLVLQLLQ